MSILSNSVIGDSCVPDAGVGAVPTSGAVSAAARDNDGSAFRLSEMLWPANRWPHSEYKTGIIGDDKAVKNGVVASELDDVKQKFGRSL